MSFPQFLVIGTAKGGSTALTALLQRHDDIFMVPHEVHFFSRDERYARGIEWYQSLFDPGTARGRMTGENSNSYTMRALHPHAVERMQRHLDMSSIRLIYLVRNPLDRIESFWIEKRSHGGDDVHHDFNRAVRQDEDWLIDPSRYWEQLSQYRGLVDDGRIHVMFSEDLKADPDGELRRCVEFLELDPARWRPGSPVVENPSEGKLVQRAALSNLRRMPGYRAASSLVPGPVRHRLRRRLFFAPVVERPRWDPTVRAWAISQLADDAQTLLAHCDRPPTFWRL